MTRARRRRRATRSATPKGAISPWLPQWEMLAYLDYCVMFTPDYRRFKQTIESHMERSAQKSWHFKDVDRRIRQLWNEFGIRTVNTYDHESVYHHGSKVLSCVQTDTNLRDRIRKRAEEIKDEYAYRRYKEKSRATRSKHLDNHISLGNDFVEFSPRRAGKKIVVEIPACGSPDKRIQGDGAPETSLDTEEVFHDAPSSRPSPAASFISDSDEPQTPGSRTSSEHGDDKLLSPSIAHCILTSKGSAVGTYPRILEKLCSNGTAAAGAEEKPSREMENPQDLRRQVVDLRRQAKFYREELMLLEELNAGLQRKLASRENAIEVLKKPDEAAIMRSLKRYSTEVQILQSKLNDRTHLGQFTKHRPKHPIGPDRTEIEDDMTLIEAGILNLWASPETMNHSSKADVSEKGDDLLYLCHKAFGKSRTRLPEVPFQSVLRSLASVAVCKWVFESDFDEPYFANSHRGDTILKHLATQDGEDVARNLDFAALTTLIKSDYCQNVLLPERALALAERLSIALAPLITVQGGLSNWSTKVLKKWEKERNKLKRVFETALQIKAKTFVGEWVYEVVLPSSGDQYDEEFMKVEGPLSATSLVELVLAPGLCRYKQERERVDCNNFRPSRSQPQQGLDWVQKALVRLQ